MNKETIELVKKMVEDGNLPQEVAIKYCPEIEKEEDEEIRKGLIRAFQSLNTIDVWNGIKRSAILAWLKKKDKQEWTEEDKPYFKKISLILSKELPAGEFHDVMTWFEHLKKPINEELDILNDATLDNNEDGLIADTIKAKSKQKWSEEDEFHFKSIESTVEYCKKEVAENDDARYLYNEDLNWFKSLKDRVFPIPQQEWSEEDEIHYKKCLQYLESISPRKEDIEWLKFLKDRYAFKPNKEQIEALENFVRSISESGYASPYDNNTKLLYSLLFDLKKLI